MKPIPENILKRMAKEDRRRMGKAGRTWEEIQYADAVNSERTLQKQVAALLTQRDIFYVQSRMDKRTTVGRGCPDFLFVNPDNQRAYGFECKMRKAEPTPAQLDCHCQMRRNGWLVFVVRTVEEARDFLDGKAQVLK